MTERNIKVAIIEAGDSYAERVDSCYITVSDDDTERAILERAMVAAADLGYKVMSHTEGGCIEMVEVTDGEAYVGVTVYAREAAEQTLPDRRSTL